MRKKSIKESQIAPREAFERHERIMEREKARRGLLMQNIEDLVQMFETQQYKAILGFDPPPTWAGYLGQVEVFYTRAEVERWRVIYTVLVQRFGIPLELFFDIAVTRLHEISRISTSKENAEEWIEKARVLTASDWREATRDALGKVSVHTCPHNQEGV